MLLTVEDDFKRKLKELRDSYASEKRRLVEVYEQKLTVLEQEKNHSA